MDINLFLSCTKLTLFVKCLILLYFLVKGRLVPNLDELLAINEEKKREYAAIEEKIVCNFFSSLCACIELVFISFS